MTRLELFVPGVPVAKGSFRAMTSKSTGKAFLVNQLKGTKPWQSYVRFCVGQEWKGPPSDKPFRLTCTFTFPRPKSHYYHRKSGDVLRDDAPTHKASTPDLGKLERPVEDAMEGIVYLNDSQIVTHRGSKPYGDRPGVRIVLEEL